MWRRSRHLPGRESPRKRLPGCHSRRRRARGAGGYERTTTTATTTTTTPKNRTATSAKKRTSTSTCLMTSAATPEVPFRLGLRLSLLGRTRGGKEGQRPLTSPKPAMTTAADHCPRIIKVVRRHFTQLSPRLRRGAKVVGLVQKLSLATLGPLALRDLLSRPVWESHPSPQRQLRVAVVSPEVGRGLSPVAEIEVFPVAEIYVSPACRHRALQDLRTVSLVVGQIGAIDVTNTGSRS